MRPASLAHCLLVVALAFVPVTATAASGTAWHLAADNDYFNFWECPSCRPDYGYTHGAEISVHTPGVPRFIARLAPRSLVASDPGGQCPWLVLGLRQEIYTPWRVRGDRPSAGWLELNLGVRNETPRRLRSARLRVGVTGPPSLADRTQSWFHHAFGFFENPDWSRQLPFEPGVALEYETAGQTRLLGGERLSVEAGPHGRLRLGTFVVDVTAGGQAVVGLRPAPPWRQSDAREANRPALYLLAAARVGVVARNEFLDGTLFRPSRGIDRYTVVPEIECGLGARMRRVRIEWHATRRAKEYPAQPAPHTYSTLAISVLPGQGP